MEKRTGEEAEKQSSPETMKKPAELTPVDQAISESARLFKEQMRVTIVPRPDFLKEEELFEMPAVKEGSIQLDGLSELILDHRVMHWISKEIEKIEEAFWEEFLKRMQEEHGVDPKYFEASAPGKSFDLVSFLKEKNPERKQALPQEEESASWKKILGMMKGDVNLSLQKKWRELSQAVVGKLSIDPPLAEQFTDRIIPIGKIGHGGSGKVYLAWHVHFQKKIALKIVNFTRPIDRTHFSREMRNLAAFDHPHIVHVYHAGFSEMGGFLALELIEGGSLNDLIDKENPLPIFAGNGRRGAIDLMITVAETVASLHEKNPPIKHNDIKPSNILLDREKVKLADFGLSNAAETDEFSPEDFAVSMTATGDIELADTEADIIFGTAAFLAPEKIDGLDPWDPRSDIYSLGVTFYQLLTGFLPIDDSDSKVLLLNAVRKDPVPIHTRRFDLHPQMADLIMSMLRKNYALRPDAKKVARLLQKMKEAWENDPAVNHALQIPDGPPTHQMKLIMEKRRQEAARRAATAETERMTQADK